MSVAAINAATSAATSSATGDTGRVAKKTLGQHEFFQLLATQLSNQDPLKPMEDTAFISQMASFSTLETMSGMASSVTALGVQQSYLNAQTLLGRVVTVTDADGAPVSGIATAIRTADDGATNVTIGGVEYPASSVIGVRLAEG